MKATTDLISMETKKDIKKCACCGKDMDMNEFDTKEALRLAGKLVICAEMVLKSHILGLSDKLLFLKDAVEDYNRYMLRSVE